MMKKMEINGYPVKIEYEDDIEMFRGEFLTPYGAADFYAKDIAGLEREGSASLEVFLAMCREDGIRPSQQQAGKLNVEPEVKPLKPEPGLDMM